MECTAIRCDKPATNMLYISFVFRGARHDYDYPYCDDDIDFFTQKFVEDGRYDLVMPARL